MSTNFSGDQRPPPRPRFRPGPGQIGAGAALKALGRRGSGGAAPRPGPATGKAASPIGLPEEQAGQGQGSDGRHLLALAQHRNMQALGRDTPFGLWALNTGLFRSILPPGGLPSDVLEDSGGGS